MSSDLPSSLSRRSALKVSALGAFGIALPAGHSVTSVAQAQKAPATAAAAAPGILPHNRFSRMVQEYFITQVREVEAAGEKRRASLKTKADAEAYVKDVREKIAKSFGPWPEKTPLNPRITGVLERDTYRVEKVIFDSRPDFPVTANLYLPKGTSGQVPGVVGSCGHSATGKGADAYQSFAQGLARLGYACLIFDPIGQGERLQFVDDQLKPKHGVGVSEHLYAGAQQSLVGEFFGAWRAWDGIRALDYLLTRPEVDPNHLGITGNSGGGTMTTWLCGVESRWTMGAPSCFVTTFRRNLENELPADTEQCPPNVLALGLDHADFIAAMAPKPVVLMGQEKDFFDARGLEEAYGRLKRLYALLGAEDNIQLHMGGDYHGYSQENREAMYRWFNRVTKVSDAKAEPPITLEPQEALWCTPKGQVGGLKPRSIFNFTQDLSRSLAKMRTRKQGAELRKALEEVLVISKREGQPDYRILRPSSGRKYPRKYAATYAVETEPGIQAIVYRLSDESLMSRPPKTDVPAILYVSHHSADAELRDDPLPAELIKAEPAAAFYACDVRGIGESRQDTCGKNTFLQPYGSDYFYSAHSLMLGRPYVGQKTFDVLRVLDWLGSIGHREVHLVAKGWGTFPATFAAVLSDAVKRVTLKNALTSYSEIAESEEYNWPVSAFPQGALAHFDLPDCYEALKAKNLRQIEQWEPMADKA